MAHNLNKTNGIFSFVKKGEKAWHGVGQYTENAMTTAEAIKLAHLDWNVNLYPIYTDLNGINTDFDLPQYRKEKKYRAAIREDNKACLGIVGENYHILQNIEAFEFFDNILETKEAIIETAGALGKGERIFITAKLPDYMRVKDEIIENYLLLTHSHDGSLGITVKFTSVCVVCNNTLQMALKDKNKGIKIKHTKNMKDNLAQASKLLDITNIFKEDLSTVINNLTEFKVTDETLYKYFNTLTNANKKLIEIFEHNYYNGLGSQLDARVGTAWGMFNAVSGYYNNLKEYRSEESRKNNLIIGNDTRNITKAFNYAKSLVYDN